MKRKLLIQSGIAMAVLFILTFGIGVGQALATTGCFLDTIGHPWETYICWMKDNGITNGTTPTTYSPNDYVTRGQMAVFMQRLDNLAVAQDATNLAVANAYTDNSLVTGQILINVGSGGDWKPFWSTDQLFFKYIASRTEVYHDIVGPNYLSLHPAIPAVLYGRSLEFVGVEFCYEAQAEAFLTDVVIYRVDASSNTGIATGLFADHTDRADSACRYYVLSTPAVLTAESTINIYIQVNWTNVLIPFKIGRTTFVLQPTTTIAVPPSVAQPQESISQTPELFDGESTIP
jgi:hypothetical protein